MRVHLDTNVIISFVDELDANHARALELLGSLEGEKVTSRLTLVELASVYSRAGLPEPLALALYSLRRVDARVVDADFNHVLQESMRLAPLLKLKILDLLHIAAAEPSGQAASRRSTGRSYQRLD